MELKRYLQILWRWLWLLLLSGILAGGIGFALSNRAIPIYNASTTLLINQASSQSASPDYNSLLTSERLAKTYAQLINKRPVLEAVVANLQLDMDPDVLKTRVQISSVQDTQLLVLTVQDSDPDRAAIIANEIVSVFSQQSHEVQNSRYAASKQSLEQELANIQTIMEQTQARLDALPTANASEQTAEQERLQTLLAQYRNTYATLLNSFEQLRLAETQATSDISVAEAAQAEKIPIQPRPLRTGMLAAVAAIILTIGFIFLAEYLDDSIKSAKDAEEVLGLPTLASLAISKGPDPANELLTTMDARSAQAEAYRLLQANIEFSELDTPMDVLAVVGCNVGDGKSTVAANLAVTFAKGGKRVILVDGDLRRPKLHYLFHKSNQRGLTTALRHEDSRLDDHIVQTDVNNLFLLPSGPLPPNPAELLGSQRISKLLDKLKAHADLVILDSPPLLPVVDATLIARLSTATLMVVRAGSTRADALRKAGEQLAHAEAHVIGVVLNGVAPSHTANYQYSYERLAGRPLWKRWRRNQRTDEPSVSNALNRNKTPSKISRDY